VPMIFTTRDLSLGGDLGIGKRLEMKPLSERQLREFVGKRLGEKGEQLLGQLHGKLPELAETPLLLKMLCDVFGQTGEIPANKGELFRLFDREYEKFKGLPAVSADFRRFKSEILQQLAFVMMQGDESKPTEFWLTIERSQAERSIEQWLMGRVSDPAGKAKEWLEDLLEHHLLQVAAEVGKVEFHHQLFQEYYAAEALLGMFADRHPDVVEPERFQHLYLNYLKWTESVAIVLSSIEKGKTAVDLVRQALDVDLMLGARLGGEVRADFLLLIVGLVDELRVPDFLKEKISKKIQSTTSPSSIESNTRRIKKTIESQAITDEKITELCSLISSPNNELRWSAIHKLERLIDWPYSDELKMLAGQKILPRLLDLIGHVDPKVRHCVAYSLLIVGDHTATQGLLKLLKDPSDDVRISAFLALEQICDNSAVPGLLEFLNDLSNSTAKANDVGFEFSLLSSMGGSEALMGLLPFLNHPDEDFRWQAIDALENMRDENAVTGILYKTRDCSSRVRSKAAHALGKISNRKVVPELINYLQSLSAGSDESYDVIEALGELGSKEAIPALHHSLARSISGDDQDIIVIALGKLGDKSVVPALIDMVQNSGYYSNIEASNILAQMNVKEAVLPMVEFLVNEAYMSLSPRMTVVKNLGLFKADKASHALPKLLTYIYGDAGEQAFYAIQKIQANCKFYNYEIYQKAQERSARVSEERSSNVTYNIDRVGNLNTGTVNIHGNQNGEQ
jgi:HEAT repeat protein